jgi:hypothetical protein
MAKQLPARGDPHTEAFPVLVGPLSERYRRLVEMYEQQARRYYSWR